MVMILGATKCISPALGSHGCSFLFLALLWKRLHDGLEPRKGKWESVRHARIEVEVDRRGVGRAR